MNGYQPEWISHEGSKLKHYPDCQRAALDSRSASRHNQNLGNIAAFAKRLLWDADPKRSAGGIGPSAVRRLAWTVERKASPQRIGFGGDEKRAILTVEKGQQWVTLMAPQTKVIVAVADCILG
jgi:hypothetical protein